MRQAVEVERTIPGLLRELVDRVDGELVALSIGPRVAHVHAGRGLRRRRGGADAALRATRDALGVALADAAAGREVLATMTGLARTTVHVTSMLGDCAARLVVVGRSDWSTEARRARVEETARVCAAMLDEGRAWARRDEEQP